VRILAIRGENLASLARSFTIDLVHGPLAGAGIFAITGPVGAGKSTLLDALCLPLFDRTPRLSGRGGVAIGDEAEDEGSWLKSHDPRSLLRRDAAAGHAEVDFVGRDGVRYRASWSVRRARRRPDGRVQEQELLLTDLDRDIVVASGRRTDVLAAIQQRLGLDFAQFCRSVLLAQGDFAAFLRASADDRARLLETLTGADVYRRLSKAAHERAREAAQRVEVLRAQLAAQAPLAAEARTAIERAAAELQQQSDVCQVGIGLASGYVSWHDEAARHRQDESAATVELQAAIAANDAAQARREALARQQRALVVVPRHELATQAAEALQRAERKLAAAGALRDEQAKAVQRAAARLAEALHDAFGAAAASAAVPALVRELPSWEPSLRQWHTAESALPGLEVAMAAAATSERDAKAARVAAEPAVATAQAARADVAAMIERAQEANAASDAEQLGRRREALARRRDAVREVAERAERWRRDVAAAASAQAAVPVAIQTAAAAGVCAVAARQRCDELAAARERLRLRRDEARARASLDALRERLVAGEPCPLCGSSEHALYAVHAGADADGLAAELAAIAPTLAAAERAAAQAAGDEQVARREAKRCQDDVTACAAAVAAAAAAFAVTGETAADADAAMRVANARAAELAPVAAALAADEAAATIAAKSLQTALRAEKQATAAWELAERRLAEAGRVESAGQAEHARLRAEHGELLRRIADARAVVAGACADWSPGIDAIAALAGDRVAALHALRRLHRDHEAALAAADAAVVARARAAEDHEQARTADGAAAAAFADARAAAQVSAEDVLDAAGLGAVALAAETAALHALQHAVDDRRAVLRERVAQRRRHEAAARPSLDADEARAALRDARAAADAVQKRLEAARVQLGADDLVRRQRDELTPVLATAERAATTWEALDGLIGSSTGDRFAVFAQELTLDLLLVEANRRLAELARRYRLRRNPGGPLDFVVVDLDLGGTSRGVQSLSGGETFLVSLALALALATLAAPKSRVETLFLDEGFGTLDAHNLEIALGALDSLQATGCQVGVISHVDGIAERIGAQVVVQPEGGGQSRVFARAR